jgi:hypothetical protein
VTGQPDPDGPPLRAIVATFPQPRRRVAHAYAELAIAANGTPQQIKALGDLRLLARPWDPPTCADPDLRAEVWAWLEEVVCWLNHEYVWDAEAMIPPCWPKHPHLVHEIAVLADLRRRAGHALTGDAMEEWHRYALPAFTERVRQRMQQHCQDRGHQPWPAQGRHTRHLAAEAVQDRVAVFRADIRTTTAPPGPPAPSGPPVRPGPSTRPRLQVVDGMNVDVETGEIVD